MPYWMLGVCLCANSKSFYRRIITVVEMCELKAEDYVRDSHIQTLQLSPVARQIEG